MTTGRRRWWRLDLWQDPELVPLEMEKSEEEGTGKLKGRSGTMGRGGEILQH